MDIFECAICFEQFKEPLVISCGHTFCKTCLQQLKPNQLRCPLCQRSFESVDSLALNFVVLKWMEENKNQIITKKDIKCENCEDRLAVVWCEKCEISFCKACESNTHSGKAFQSHIRLGIKEKSKKPTFTKCKSHMRDNEIYCVDCQSLMCTICVIDYHQQHKAQSVSKCAEEKRVVLKSYVAPFQNLEPIVKKEQDFRLALEKDEVEKKSIETRLKVLNNQICQHNLNIKQITNRTEKIKTSEIVLINSIQEMRDMDLLDNKNIEIMIKKIQDVLKEVYPEGDKERLEKERLEKERLEKERLEKERLEKERLEKERLEKLIVFSNNPLSATMPIPYQVNKGGLLTLGRFIWSVYCDNVVPSYDLGVVSPSHTDHFNQNQPTAWGVREHGYIMHKRETVPSMAFGTGDTLDFKLDLFSGTLTVKVQRTNQSFVIGGVIAPVHIAFSGGAGSRATITKSEAIL